MGKECRGNGKTRNDVEGRIATGGGYEREGRKRIGDGYETRGGRGKGKRNVTEGERGGEWIEKGR